MLALLPLVPVSFGGFGRFGLECKTRKCTVINMGTDGNPTSINPKANVGVYSLIVAVILIIGFSGAIYSRLWVN